MSEKRVLRLPVDSSNYGYKFSSPALDLCYSFSVNREIVGGVLEKLVMSHIPQINSLKKPVLSCLDCQLHDLDGQISQGEELLKSGRSVNPGQLSAQLAILSKQRADLLAKRGGLEASS